MLRSFYAFISVSLVPFRLPQAARRGAPKSLHTIPPVSVVLPSGRMSMPLNPQIPGILHILPIKKTAH